LPKLPSKYLNSPASAMVWGIICFGARCKVRGWSRLQCSDKEDTPDGPTHTPHPLFAPFEKYNSQFSKSEQTAPPPFSTIWLWGVSGVSSEIRGELSDAFTPSIHPFDVGFGTHVYLCCIARILEAWRLSCFSWIFDGLYFLYVLFLVVFYRRGCNTPYMSAPWFLFYRYMVLGWFHRCHETILQNSYYIFMCDISILKTLNIHNDRRTHQNGQTTDRPFLSKNNSSGLNEYRFITVHFSGGHTWHTGQTKSPNLYKYTFLFELFLTNGSSPFLYNMTLRCVRCVLW